MQVVNAVGQAITYVRSASVAVQSGSFTIGQALTVAAVQTGLAVGGQAVVNAIAQRDRTEGKPVDFRLDTNAGIVTAYGRVGCGRLVFRCVVGGEHDRV